jgi:hypothetical protein
MWFNALKFSHNFNKYTLRPKARSRKIMQTFRGGPPLFGLLRQEEAGTHFPVI